MVKTLPANVGVAGSLPGSGRSLEEEMATHSSTLAWRIPCTEEPGRFGVAKSRTRLSIRHSLRDICLESRVLFFQHGSHWSLVPCNNPQRLAGLRLWLVDSLMVKSQQVSAEVADSSFALTVGLWLGGWVSLRQPAVF